MTAFDPLVLDFDVIAEKAQMSLITLTSFKATAVHLVVASWHGFNGACDGAKPPLTGLNLFHLCFSCYGPRKEGWLSHWILLRWQLYWIDDSCMEKLTKTQPISLLSRKYMNTPRRVGLSLIFLHTGRSSNLCSQCDCTLIKGSHSISPIYHSGIKII